MGSLSKDLRRAKLLRLMGRGITSARELAQECGVSERTIYDDKKALQERIQDYITRDQRENLTRWIHRLQQNYEAAENTLWSLVERCPHPGIRLGALNTIIRAQEQHIALLQSLGMLPREPESVTVQNYDMSEVVRRAREAEKRRRELQAELRDAVTE